MSSCDLEEANYNPVPVEAELTVEALYNSDDFKRLLITQEKIASCFSDKLNSIPKDNHFELIQSLEELMKENSEEAQE